MIRHRYKWYELERFIVDLNNKYLNENIVNPKWYQFIDGTYVADRGWRIVSFVWVNEGFANCKVRFLLEQEFEETTGYR